MSILNPSNPAISDGFAFGKTLNLLDNWYFLDPINQRCKSSYSDEGYTIDRWKLTSGTMTVDGDGITLDGTLEQILENGIIGTVAASVLTDAGPAAASYDNTTKTFSITANGEKIIAAKLELASVQTMCHQENGKWVLNDPPPNKALELAKCQRYQFATPLIEGSSYILYGIGYAYSNHVILMLSVPVTLRSPPTISHDGDFTLSNKTAFSNGIPVDRIALGASGIKNGGVGANCVYLDVYPQDPSQLTAGEIYFLGSRYGAKLLLDANL